MNGLSEFDKGLFFLLAFWFLFAFTAKCIGDISAAHSQSQIKNSLESIAQSLNGTK